MGKVSFSSKMKTDLCKIKPTGCCRYAEIYGLLLFGRSFCKEDISIYTKSHDTAELYSSLLKVCFSVHTAVEKMQGGYVVSVPGEADRILSLIDYTVPLYCKEGKSQLVIAIGCTGGKHRSVTFAELIHKHLTEKNYNTAVNHRDIDKE